MMDGKVVSQNWKQVLVMVDPPSVGKTQENNHHLTQEYLSQNLPHMNHQDIASELSLALVVEEKEQHFGSAEQNHGREMKQGSSTS